MIVVVGFNTAIDKLIDLDALTPGAVVRATETQARPGGKGAHAAMCAALFGDPVRLVGLIDAPHRDAFTRALRDRGVRFDAIDMPSPPRTCLAIREQDGRVTEILEPGPVLDAEVCGAAYRAAVSAGRDARLAILSGSVPRGMPPSTYADFVRDVAPTDAIVDASGALLDRALAAGPYCVKANGEEAAVVARITIDSVTTAAAAARWIAGRARLAVVSLGASGVVACWDGTTYHVQPPTVAALNAVGAGDCLAGALAASLARGDSVIDALRLGAAAGTAKVVSHEIGAVRREDIDAVLPLIRVTRLRAG